jgi:ATP-dependent DNA ligase
MRQEFVIGGYTDPHGARTGIGSLLLGYYDEKGVLRYAGNVRQRLQWRLAAPDARDDWKRSPPTQNPIRPPRAVPGRGNHWVKPELVAEVSRTRDGRARAIRSATRCSRACARTSRPTPWCARTGEARSGEG